MEVTGLGGGILLAIAAALWLLYLMPNWLKNREYIATEKNAVRLQQTIRVLAETSEVPRLVRADAAARRAAKGPVAVGRAPRPSPAQTAAGRRAPQLSAPQRRGRRLRRTRAFTSLVLLASFVTFAVQVGMIVSVGPVVASWLVVGGAALTSLTCFAALGRLADIGRARPVSIVPVVRRTSLGHVSSPVAVVERAEWTPVAMPAPLYLSRQQAAPARLADPVFELEIAAAASERALRARDQPVSVSSMRVAKPFGSAPVAVPVAPATVTPEPVGPAPVAPRAAPVIAAPAPLRPSRFATMGIVGDATIAPPDLDAVLARRRATG